VLQLHNRHATRGGADDVLDLERTLLESAGHDVEQLTVAPGGELSKARAAVSAVWNRQVAAELQARIASFVPDVVHVHTPFPTMSPAVFAVAHGAGIATVTTCHSYRYSCIQGTLRRSGSICESCVGSRSKWPGVVHGCYHDSRLASLPMTVSLALQHVRGRFENVDRFITLTDFGRKILMRDGIAPERIVVKPNAVADPGASARPPAAGAPYIAFAGRLVEEKGVATLLAAAEILGDRRIVIAGDGPMRAAVQQQERNSATSDMPEAVKVEYRGWLDEPELTEMIGGAAVCVVPSEWYEAGPPLTLLRSLAAGVPVVCSDLENIASTVLETGAGRTFRVGDPRALAGALAAALDDEAWLTDASHRARQLYLRDHTPEVTVNSLEQIYHTAIDAAECRTGGSR
jgi:glycosyltransferase involved in cell wall biosynthesis